MTLKNSLVNFFAGKRGVLVCLASFLFLFISNFLTGYTSDDYAYRFVFQVMPTDPVEKIDGIQSIVKSQIHHYNIWNGRFLAHSIVQFFMQYNKIVFDVFNSAAVILLALILTNLASITSGIKNNYKIVFFTLASLWIFIPDFGKTSLWVSGSGNYLWMSLFYMAFLLLMTSKAKSSFAIVIIAIFIGLLAGATNENSGPAAILMASMMVALDSFLNRRILIWKILCISCACIGSYLIISAPGAKRLGGVDMSIATLFKHFETVFNANISLFLVAYIIMASILIYAIAEKKISRNDILYLLIFLSGHFSALYSMVFSPYFVPRTAFGSSVFLILATSFLFFKVCDLRIYSRGVLILMSVALIIMAPIAFRDLYRSYVEVQRNIAILNNSNPDEDIKLKMISKPKSSYNAYNGTAYLNTNTTSWFNSWMAKYYGVKSITGHY